MAKRLKNGKEVFPEKKKKKKIGFLIAGILVLFGILSIFILPGGAIQERITQQEIPIQELQEIVPEKEPQREAPMVEQSPRTKDIPQQEEVYEVPVVTYDSTGVSFLNLLKDIISLLSTAVGILVGIKTLKENKSKAT